MKRSGHLSSFTLAPINEASDTHLAGFGTAAGLTEAGVNWVNKYIRAVFELIAKVDKRIPLMLQDSFKGAAFWAPSYKAGTNLVMDVHVYYFAAAGTYSTYVLPAICGQAQYLKSNETKFPTFVGEWSLQVSSPWSFVRSCSLLCSSPRLTSIKRPCITTLLRAVRRFLILRGTHGRSTLLVELSGLRSATLQRLSTERVPSVNTGATLTLSMKALPLCLRTSRIARRSEGILLHIQSWMRQQPRV